MLPAASFMWSSCCMDPYHNELEQVPLEWAAQRRASETHFGLRAATYRHHPVELLGC
jgi:hypothetical protein